MDTNERWCEFMANAESILLAGQKVDTYKQTIQFASQPTFAKSFFLQIVIDGDNVQWYRTTWDRVSDAPKFYNIMESLKYIGQKIEPSIFYENGTMQLEQISDVLEFSKKICLKPVVNAWKGIMLDGIYYTIIFGVENSLSSYKWLHLPEEWEQLDHLAELLETMNDNL